MPTQARSAYGTQFRIGASVVPEVISVTDLGSRKDLVDVSAHDGNGYSSEIGGLKRNNPVRILMNYVPGNATQDLFKDHYEDNTTATYSVVNPGTPTVTTTFSGIVSQWQFQPFGVSTAQQIEAIVNPDGPLVTTVT